MTDHVSRRSESDEQEDVTPLAFEKRTSKGVLENMSSRNRTRFMARTKTFTEAIENIDAD